MTRMQTLAALGLAAGLGMGGALDRVPEYVPTSTGGYYVLAADFHVHGFLGDGALPPWEVAPEARRRGLQVIALTNHNQLSGARVTAALSSGLPIVIVSEEITAPAFHLAAIGVSQPVDWRLSARDAIDAVHAQGGVAIAAHPVPDSWRDDDAGALARLDGIEVAHPVVESTRRGREQLRSFRERVQRVNPHVALIGSSDFHFSGGMGRYRTYVLAREVSRAGVLEALRAGRTVASDADGRLTGRDRDVALVTGYLLQHPRTPGPSPVRRLAAALVLAALAALVLAK